MTTQLQLLNIIINFPHDHSAEFAMLQLLTRKLRSTALVELQLHNFALKLMKVGQIV